MHGRRPDHRTPWMRTLLLAAALSALLASCSWTAGKQYFVHWSAGRQDVIIRERSSWDLTLARELFHGNNDTFRRQMGGFSCHANRNWTSADRCVFRLLHERTSVPGLAAGVWDRATSDVDADRPRFRDFQGAFRAVIASEDDRLQVADCLTLSHSTLSQQNWTVRSRSDANCRTGEHAWA